MKKSKLVLGTVQFGLDYGINNHTGQVNINEVKSILSNANDCGIETLDTSHAYGNSELVLGKCLSDNKNIRYNIISKYPQSAKPVNEIFNETLQRLNQKHLYGYLIHHFDFYKNHLNIWNDFIELKAKGLVDKIGFSLYSTDELDFLLENDIEFDILQFPFNIFDKQFGPYMENLYQKGIEIHTRSVFLQGLFFKDISSLPLKLIPLKQYLEFIHSYCKNHNTEISELALNYVLNNPYIMGVLIGVDNLEQLKSNITVAKKGISSAENDLINSMQIKETGLLNPINWK